jgi:hypothetical protein
MFHTAYNSYESRPGGRDYIGKHSAEDPYDDYLGSFSDGSFDPDTKIVMAYSKTAEGAVWFEVNFHNVFNVDQDPGYANKVKQTSTKFDSSGLKWTDEQKLNASKVQSEVQNRPEVKEKKSKSITKSVNDPVVKAKHKEAMKRIGQDPKAQAKKSASRKASSRNPNLTESWKIKQREAQKKSQNRPETKELKSKRIRERFQDPEVREKILSNPRDHNKGKKWYTNGEESSMHLPGDEPTGWRQGRIDPRRR